MIIPKKLERFIESLNRTKRGKYKPKPIPLEYFITKWLYQLLEMYPFEVVDIVLYNVLARELYKTDYGSFATLKFWVRKGLKAQGLNPHLLGERK